MVNDNKGVSLRVRVEGWRLRDGRRDAVFGSMVCEVDSEDTSLVA